MTIEDLRAKEEIKDVIKRLARGTDRFDEELMASCYHPDGVDDHNSFRGSGTDFAKWVCQVLPHFQATMHLMADPYVELDGDVAQCNTYCQAPTCLSTVNETSTASPAALTTGLARPSDT
jgi:hypothetical protein